MRSIREVLGTGDFVRVKLGVGRPRAGGEVADYVLSRFASEERKKLDTVLANSVTALEVLLSEGVVKAMNEFNNRDISI
jgi:PTH1 family peptidyl-tRNA hydrolase